MKQSVPKHTGLDKFFFSFKIIRIRDSQQKEMKKGRETMTRKRIKSEFYFYDKNFTNNKLLKKKYRMIATKVAVRCAIRF